MSHPSERQAIARSNPVDARGESAAVAAFDWLADQHLERSYRLARAILRDPGAAEDATHDAFVQAWRHWNDLRDPARFEQWFTRILINTCRNHLRRTSRVRDISADIPVSSDEVGKVDDRQAVAAALAQLSPDHRVVVALRYYRDMTVDDISRYLGVAAGTVNSRLHYAVKHLGSIIDRSREDTHDE